VVTSNASRSTDGTAGLPGFLGVSTDPTAATSGAAVVGVQPGSPAGNAGIVAGDTITSVDGQAIVSSDALSAQIHSHHPGDRVIVSWTGPSGASHSAAVTLTTGPAD
jgi:S1-C subfamily serine protease